MFPPSITCYLIEGAPSTGTSTTGKADDKRAEEGLGFDYGYEHFIRHGANSHRVKVHETDPPGAISDQFKNAQKFSSCFVSMSPSTRVVIDESNSKLRLLHFSETNAAISNYYIDKSHLTYLTYTIANAILAECIQEFVDKGKGPQNPPKLHFVIGGTHIINPFGSSIVKNDIATYDHCIPVPDERSITVATANYLTCRELGPILNAYGSIFMDMSASLAFYDPSAQKVFNGHKNKVTFVVMMGGVLSIEEINTTGFSGNMNRFTCATINQLYHPENCWRFLSSEFAEIHIVSNNSVIKLLSFLGKAPFKRSFRLPDEGGTPEVDIADKKESPHEAAFNKEYDEFKNKCTKTMKLFDSDRPGTINKVFDAYYYSRPDHRKLYNVLSACVLCCKFIDLPDVTGASKAFLVDRKYGLAIISNRDSVPRKIFEDLYRNGYARTEEKLLLRDSEGEIIQKHLRSGEATGLVIDVFDAFCTAQTIDQTIAKLKDASGASSTSLREVKFSLRTDPHLSLIFAAQLGKAGVIQQLIESEGDKLDINYKDRAVI